MDNLRNVSARLVMGDGARLSPSRMRVLLSSVVPKGIVRYLTASFPKILMYHAIVADESRLHVLFPGRYISVSQFERHMWYIWRYYLAIGLREIIQQIRDGMKFPQNCICVTFDDGFANNVQLALPILERYRIPAIMFPVTGFVDGEDVFWTGRVDALFLRWEGEELDVPFMEARIRTRNVWDRREGAVRVRCRMKQMAGTSPLFGEAVAWLRNQTRSARMKEEQGAISWDELREWRRAGFDVGAHTVNHPILSKISLVEGKEEILRGKQRLEEKLEEDIDVFAYPYGNRDEFCEEHELFLEVEGFRGAVCGIPGIVDSDPNRLFSLRRYEGKQDFRDFVAHVSGFQHVLCRAVGWQRG